jgi:hypothetical protein
MSRLRTIRYFSLLASLAEESLDEQGERKMELRDLHEEERIKLTDI